jgi:hypothetical protein
MMAWHNVILRSQNYYLKCITAPLVATLFECLVHQELYAVHFCRLKMDDNPNLGASVICSLADVEYQTQIMDETSARVREKARIKTKSCRLAQHTVTESTNRREHIEKSPRTDIQDLVRDVRV